VSVANDDLQRNDGCLPFAGPDINAYSSDTYHMASLIGTYDLFWFSGDTTWLSSIWSKYKLALQFIIAKIDSTDLIYVTLNDDWGRMSQGGYNTEANMLLYHVLNTGSKLASSMNEPALRDTLAGLASRMQLAINAKLYDTPAGYALLPVPKFYNH